MQSELKPCAHCGGEARLWSVIMPFDADCDSITVQCADCDAIGADVLVDQDVHSQSDLAALEVEAIAAWNARASDAEITRLTEALRAAEEQVKGLRDKFLNVADDAGETYLGWVEKGCDPADAIRVIGWIEDFARRALKGPSHDK